MIEFSAKCYRMPLPWPEPLGVIGVNGMARSAPFESPRINVLISLAL